jgi:hypothetical protein
MSILKDSSRLLRTNTPQLETPTTEPIFFLHIPNLANKPFFMLLPQELLIFQLKATASQAKQASKQSFLPSFLPSVTACLPVCLLLLPASR